MRVLVIDDLPDTKDVGRYDQIALNYNEAIEHLRSEAWDIVWIDHDLGEGKTGYDVMCWIEEHPEFMPREIRITTRNPVGRKRMMQVLAKLNEQREYYD